MNEYNHAAEFIQKRINDIPETGIILGSGLGSLSDKIEQKIIIPYNEIPHFVSSTAIGHQGNLIYGIIEGKKTLTMQGRFHYYEGYSMYQVTFPIRVMKLLGIKNLLISNAAGGVNISYKVGDLMIIQDHINLAPNPLIGPNEDTYGLRFPDMTRVYDVDFIRIAENVANTHNISVKKGVYICLTGPSYETPAEYNFCRIAGADAVGMSTVPEAIVARHAGLRVFGMSVISNEGFHFSSHYKNNSDEVIAAAKSATESMSLIFKNLISKT